MSCTEDEAAYRLLAKAGYPVYEKEFVLSGVLKQVYTVGCLREPLTSLILTTALPLCSAFLHPGVARARARPCRCTRAGRSCNCNHDHYHDHNICKQGTQSTKEIDGSLFWLLHRRCRSDVFIRTSVFAREMAATSHSHKNGGSNNAPTE